MTFGLPKRHCDGCDNPQGRVRRIAVAVPGPTGTTWRTIGYYCAKCQTAMESEMVRTGVVPGTLDHDRHVDDVEDHTTGI